MGEVFDNPRDWPAQIIGLFEHALTCSYASLTRAGNPITWPMTPYLHRDRSSIDVSTGVTYPAKAERARNNPRVALLFADHVGVNLVAPPIVLVHGLATVRDSDLQANTDRYVAEAMAKTPRAYRGYPWSRLMKMTWYWTRMWVEVTPVRMWWWPHGELDDEPHLWAAPDGPLMADSDPAPQGKAPPPWADVPEDWRPLAVYCLGRLEGVPHLTFARRGWPICVPVRRARAAPDGFYLRLNDGIPFDPEGPACLTWHTHAERFTGQENYAFVGTVARETDPKGTTRWRFVVQRPLGEFILPGGRIRRTRKFLGYGKKLAPRLEAEVARRGQTVPVVKKPG